MEQDIYTFREKMEGEFRIRGECALRLLITKLDIINSALLIRRSRNVIQMRSGRLKSFGSVCKKLEKKGLEPDFDVALERINDLVGVRAICSYLDDIYQVANLLKKQEDVRLLKEKDYIKCPKKSGYQSLHLILEVAIPFQRGAQWTKAELQLRTAAMDYWASLDHQLRYKKGNRQAQLIDGELRSCAETIAGLDERMLAIRRKIEEI